METDKQIEETDKQIEERLASARGHVYGYSREIAVKTEDLEAVLRANRELRIRVDELLENNSKLAYERQAVRTESPTVVRNKKQISMIDWAKRVFGAVAIIPKERAMRVVEEAIEIGQCLGITLDEVVKIAARAYERPVGEVRQEIGGLSVTILALCQALHLSADELENEEIVRVLALDVEKIRKKHADKVAAGTALASPNNLKEIGREFGPEFSR